LIVGGGRKDLRLLGGDDGVAGDQGRHDPSDGLDAQAQGVHVKKNHRGFSALPSRQDAGLNGSSICYSLIRIDSPGRLLAVKELFD